MLKLCLVPRLIDRRRQCFVDALGGAAVLANDPFRINAYEKLCELRLARGLGLRAAVDFVLCALDTLYSTRERLAEARLKLREQGMFVWTGHATWRPALFST